MLRVACREEMLPGSSYEEKWANAAATGLEAIEVTGPRPGRQDIEENLETLERLASRTGLPVSAICGSSRGCLLASDREERDAAMQDLKRLLKIASSLGAEGVIYGPTVGMVLGWSRSPRIPDLSPVETRAELEYRLLSALLGELGGFAQQVGVTFLLEPINRFEAYWPNRACDAVKVCRTVGNPRVMTVLDAFHMNIEEPDVEAAILEARGHIGYVHLSENDRGLPGKGHMDFQGFLRALSETGYRGYVSLECNRPKAPIEELAASVSYLRAVSREVMPSSIPGGGKGLVGQGLGRP